MTFFNLNFVINLNNSFKSLLHVSLKLQGHFIRIVRSVKYFDSLQQLRNENVLDISRTFFNLNFVINCNNSFKSFLDVFLTNF